MMPRGTVAGKDWKTADLIAHLLYKQEDSSVADDEMLQLTDKKTFGSLSCR